MRIRALVLMPPRAAAVLSLLAAAVLAVGTGHASAATLFTTTGHTTRVPVGATASATATSPLDWTSGTAVINKCTHSSLHLVFSENSDATVVGTVVGGSFTPCVSAGSGNFGTPWRLTVSGSGTMSATNTVWGATIDSVSFNLLGGTYSGNLTTGVTAIQPTVATSPICIRLANAGSLSGPLFGDARLDGQYCLSGSAAAFSLTN